MATIKELIVRKEKSVVLVAEGLRESANSLLLMPNISVTQKPQIPSVAIGASFNDYCSLAKYWWPDLNKEGGIPYIRRDGYVNPECYADSYDFLRLKQFAESVLLLSVAAFILPGDSSKAYAKKAREMTVAWLIDPITKQTPHFKFSQINPGSEKISFYGTIEARYLIYVCEALQLLKHIDAVTESEFIACQEWFASLSNWFETSDQGVLAKEAKNNIGFWVDLQRLIYARFSGQNCLANKIFNEDVFTKIDKQITENGQLPHEIKRTFPYDYVTFTLLAMAGLNAASSNGDLKLAEFSTEDGRSFQKVFDWFNQTLHVSGLEEKANTLSKLVQARQEIRHLIAENNNLHEKNKLLPTLKADDISKEPNNIPDNIWHHFDVTKKENVALRHALNNEKQLYKCMSIQYREICYLLQESKAQLVSQKELEEKNKELEKINSFAKSEIEKKTIELNNKVVEFDNKVKQIEVIENLAQSEIKNLTNELEIIKVAKNSELNQMKNDLDLAKSELNQSESNLNKAKNNLSNVKNEFSNAKNE
ncbi:MAG: alginate lyase family protein, partial [Defluviitaleaceae bacterium]|nr:alginate lyase family protein [Defluviitaleaceae bacterium]